MPGFKIKEQEGYDLSTAEKETVEAITVLGDPGADRILFWDKSANTWKFLTIGTGLNITATTLTSTGLSNPMTAIGDMIYGDTAGAVARLAGNTTTTKKFLTSVGDGTNSTAPAYSLDFSTDGTFAGNSDTIVPSQKAIKTYVDGSVAGLLDYRGGYDASGNTYPTTGGSGTAGAVLKGDMWVISVAGTLGGEAVQIGDSIIANVDTPAQTASNWNHLNANISYVPENVANRLAAFQGTPDDTHYPSEKLVKDSLDAKLAITSKASSSEINGGTDNDKYITPDALAGSNVGTSKYHVKICDETTAITTGDGKFIFTIPQELNGMNLVGVVAMVSTVSSSGLPTVQIRNVTDAVDMLTTRVTIDVSEYNSYDATTPAVIDEDHDDVATGDRIAIDVDVAGTGAKGLEVYLLFRLP